MKVAVTDEGNIFLEVDPDVYGKVKNLKDKAIDLINGSSVAAGADWVKVRKIIHERSGNAGDITLFPARLSR